MTTAPPITGALGGRPAGAPVRFSAQRLSFLDRLQTAAVFYIGIWSISPPLFASDWGRRVAAVAVGMWLVGEMVRPGGVILKPGPRVLVAVAFMAYTAFISAYVDGVQAVVANIQLFICLTFLIFFESARRVGLPKYRWVLWATLLILPIWMINTLSALSVDRFASRTVVRASEEAAAYMLRGVGGYGLVYSTVMIVPALLYLSANLPPLSRTRRGSRARAWAWAQRLIAGAGAFLGALLVIRAGYSIAAAALTLGLLAYLLLRGNPSYRTIRIGAVISVAAVVMALSQTSLIGSALDGLTELARGTTYYSKIEDLRASVQTDTSVGTVHGRTERYMRSLELFFRNPLVGTLSYGAVGKHSVVLDTFAQFGILGGAAFVYLIFSVPLMLLRASVARIRMSGAAAAYLIVMAICAVFNDLAASMGLAAFIIYPLAMTYGHDDPLRGRRLVRVAVGPAGRLTG